MKKQIPNILTMLRIILVPWFLWITYISQPENFIIWITAIFIIASITDYLDGMLARKFDVISNFGKIMDPLADKLLVISALLALYTPLHFISMPVIIIIVSREVIITILRDYYAKKGIYVAANNWGKVKTVFQMVGLVGVLVYASVLQYLELPANSSVQIFIRIYFWITAAITLYSGMNYIIRKEK